MKFNDKPRTTNKKLVLSIVYCLLSIISFSQLNFDYIAGKFLIKGKIQDIETHKPIPLANIKIVNSGKGLTSENDGSFVMYVSINDTLKFSSTGYIAKVIHIRDIDSSKYYTLQIELMHDFIKLKDVMIYPFRDLDEFRKAFIEAKNINKVTIAGIAPPKYSNITPRAKFNNPISFLYERVKKRRAANPDFKP